MQSDDYRASAPRPDATSFSKHLTHFMSHFLTTHSHPVSRFRNNSINVELLGYVLNSSGLQLTTVGQEKQSNPPLHWFFQRDGRDVDQGAEEKAGNN
jgi:hypothetical protein